MTLEDFVYVDDVLEKMTPRQLEHYRERLSVIGRKELDKRLSDIYRRKREAYKQSDKYRERQEFLKPKKRGISDIFGFKF